MSAPDTEPDYDTNQPDQASDLGQDYFYVEDAS
jgi:hypothetical protein